MKQLSILITLLCSLTQAAFGQTDSQCTRLTANDYKIVFQLAVDYPDLQKYYHTDTDTTRQNIVFVTHDFESINHGQLRGVIKFGRQVSIITEQKIKDRNIKSYFVIVSLLCNTNSIYLKLSYPIEGLMISYLFENINNKLVITSAELVEI
ncbi:hypothetical protein J7E24_15270 [Hymenobacter sp. ISL-91]|uniref:hypothetical protein n=1 Tax=Hymenobacter sp. ISL-91 TaxID=2819151 RepID=UPI001BEA0703|nr:hypothetical protein [Hymenobacter sp. ISL-91]MBT2559150.1 hypothetical protein [Hymenobacter sp. ISL-91]